MSNAYTREDIKQRLRMQRNWIEYDIDKTVNIMFSVRTSIRKHLKDKPINDKLLLNNIIISSNIFGIELSYTIYQHICGTDEMTYINSLYHFLMYKENEPLDAYFIELLHRNCDMYVK